MASPGYFELATTSQIHNPRRVKPAGWKQSARKVLAAIQDGAKVAECFQYAKVAAPGVEGGVVPPRKCPQTDSKVQPGQVQ